MRSKHPFGDETWWLCSTKAAVPILESGLNKLDPELDSIGEKKAVGGVVSIAQKLPGDRKKYRINIKS